MMLNKNHLNKTSILPEKVLQFGTGVLLRGLVDYFIDKANKNDVFNGSVVMVKTTGPDVSEFTQQDNLYTISVRGIENNQLIEEDIIIECLSRVLSSKTHWEEILKTAENPEIQIVVSNTTEAGLQYTEENVLEGCPDSYPGKLVAWLHRRYLTVKTETVVIPTELIVDNGKVLKDIVYQHISHNKLGEDFTKWLDKKVRFCSSLVDRIVPGKPNQEEAQKLFEKIGYTDNLIIKSEVYRLWAIEGENLEDILTFAEVDNGVKIAKNIEKYRELKLRLLNAPHSLLSGMAYLSGFKLVKDALNDEMMEKYITILMLTELGPAIPLDLDLKTIHRYGREVMDRFRNPYLEHQWISITLQYTLKMKARVIPLLLNYYKAFDTVPQYFARCFAAYLLFMKATKEVDGKYFGEYNGVEYPINCDSAGYFKSVWDNHNAHEVVTVVLKNKELWGTDLSLLHDFESNVESHLSNMQMLGVKDVVSALNVYA
ncbi:tagaturonate reductase [Lacihabitans sp. LS3-19]|uniref:tagaturonate reductase n=1 Tax=Lacihabitans sp. LS3-19 TaxID=2487335 RepID=UPI0020CD56ED|nr:tagaturonate reductase [Lacihabitans sp. LS3-19]MCP9766318.1 tagaturonate reductase [Lacihabitans sp. LS3-19]